METISSGKTLEHPEIAPEPPAFNVQRIRESEPARTCRRGSVFSMYFKVLSKLPELSLIPMILSNSANFLTVVKAILLPVRAGML